MSEQHSMRRRDTRRATRLHDTPLSTHNTNSPRGHQHATRLDNRNEHAFRDAGYVMLCSRISHSGDNMPVTLGCCHQHAARAHAKTQQRQAARGAQINLSVVVHSSDWTEASHPHTSTTGQWTAELLAAL